MYIYIYVYIMYVFIYVYHNFHHSHVSKREFPKIKLKPNYPDVEFFKQNVSMTGLTQIKNASSRKIYSK